LASIRNLAVIAHVDHGKTTLIDGILQQTGTVNNELNDRVMDSNDIEKERGITILSKNTSIFYKDYKINIIDTPGHADFGGEVERVLKMVDGVLLLVDAQEGVMPQTRFVVKKAISLGITPIVVVNKIDKPASRCDEVVDEVFDLFVSVDATDEQLDFPVVYAIARDGIAKLSLEEDSDSLTPLLDTIVKNVPAPKGDIDAPTQLQVFTLDHDNYVGKIGIARIFNGKIKNAQQAVLVKSSGEQVKGKVSRLLGFKGLERMEVDEAESGDIVAIAGFNDIDVGDTLCDPLHIEALDPLHIEEPTLSVVFAVNDSPFAGTEGKFITGNKIKDRLEAEMNTNIAMRLDVVGDGKFQVSGRGELQITILAENMRREGFEFSISRPVVILKEEDGKTMEPYEHLVVDTPEEFSGSVIEKVGKRKGEMTSMVTMKDGTTRVEFKIPAKGLIGYRSEFLTDTKGEGILNHSFMGYLPYVAVDKTRAYGALISSENGVAVGYSLFNIQSRGALFVGPQAKVYVGMIIGEHSRDNDLDVNASRGKQLTNVRSSGTDDAIKLVPPRDMNLESALEWIEDDEIIEVTPVGVRIRKRNLDASQRKREAKKK
jgi:GTP-binding protein